MRVRINKDGQSYFVISMKPAARRQLSIRGQRALLNRLRDHMGSAMKYRTKEQAQKALSSLPEGLSSRFHVQEQWDLLTH